MDYAQFDTRPIMVAIAGPNGAGKTTFFNAHLASVGLRFVNADLLAHELSVEPYDAAQMANALRRELTAQRESFVFETVFSDPVGDKVAFLEQAVADGYHVVLCFVGISGPDVSVQRVSMRVSQGGHDVPDEKLQSRFPRIIQNLKLAIKILPAVLVFDNNDLAHPYRQIATFEQGKLLKTASVLPEWFTSLVPIE